MAGVTVRRARPEDLPSVLGLWDEMMAFHAHLDARFAPAAGARERFAPTVQAWMADPARRVLVAVAGAEIVGYTIGVIADNPPIFDLLQYGYVTDICVAPEWRQNGIGRRMFTALCRWFRRGGMSVVQLNVAAFNPVSSAFWREQGFGEYLNRLWLDLHQLPSAPSAP